MIDISWLNFVILILAAFSIYYLIINEVSVYFLKKSYISKWALSFIVSILLVLLKNYVPSSFTYLLVLAIVGGVEFICTLVTLMKERKDFNLEKEEEYKKVSNIFDEVFEYYQNQIAASKNGDSVINSNSPVSTQAPIANSISDKTNKTNGRSPSKINVSVKDTKIINSDRMYGQQEFLKESQGQQITLSPFLRSNLDHSNTTTKI